MCTLRYAAEQNRLIRKRFLKEKTKEAAAADVRRHQEHQEDERHRHIGIESEWGSFSGRSDDDTTVSGSDSHR